MKIMEKWNNKWQGRRNRKTNQILGIWQMEDFPIDWLEGMTEKKVEKVLDIKYAYRYEVIRQLDNKKTDIVIANLLVELEDGEVTIIDEIAIDYMNTKKQDSTDMRFKHPINRITWNEALDQDYSEVV